MICFSMTVPLGRTTGSVISVSIRGSKQHRHVTAKSLVILLTPTLEGFSKYKTSLFYTFIVVAVQCMTATLSLVN